MRGHRGGRYSPSRSLCANLVSRLALHSVDLPRCGGGFVPQLLIDSSGLTDSTIVRIAKNGHKGKFFIQFSFSFRRYTGLQGSGTQHPVPLCSQNYEDKRGVWVGLLLAVCLMLS